MRCLWDTDIVSAYIKQKNAYLNQRVTASLRQYRRAEISLITRYEILRGLAAKRASRQISVFEVYCRNHVVLPLADAIVVRAADIWAALQRTGQPIGDLDPMIAATALHHGLTLATGNVAHFQRIPGLTVEDWTRP